MNAVFDYIDNFELRLGKTPFFDLRTLIIFLIGYLAMSFVGPKLFRGSKLKLNFISIIHNWVLILWSITMNIGIIVAIYRRTVRMGFYRAAICTPDSETYEIAMTGDLAFWLYNFYISKYYELIDTVLLIVKGKPLIFLHVFHHFMMLIGPFTWIYDGWIIGGWWCVFVNTIIHTFMYYYYFLTSIGYQPKWKSFMTTSQIIQLLSGWLLVWYWLYIRNRDGCTRGIYTALFSHVINTILILFFLNFYYQQYINKRKSKRGDSNKKEDSKTTESVKGSDRKKKE